MKKHLQLAGILMLVMAFAVSSCKKDDEDDSNNVKDILTSGNWKITAMTVDPGVDFGGGFVINDLYSMMPAYTKDDFVTFQSDGKVIFDEGPTKYQPSDPQTTEGTWSLSSDNKTLTIKEPGEDDMVVTITEISSSTMKGNYVMEEDFGAGTQTYTVSITMSKQ